MSAAIEVNDLSKRFRIYTNRPRSIKETATSRRQKRFEDFWALRDVSFEVEQGTMFGFIGHNGSGKSTMLRCITGIYKPTSGSVNVKGRISALLELGSGFHPDLSGRENVYLNAAILGLSKKEIDLVFDDIVEFSGVGKFIDSPVKVYSSGMYVRLGFAVAVHVNPEILIIDEVIAVGDEEFQRRCFEHIYQLRAQGVTIVLVSHSLGLIQTMCDHAAWFDHGQLRSVGTAVQVVGDYLKSVNSDEETRMAEQELPEGVTVDAGTRRGSGELRFTDVAITDASGTRTMFGQTGKPMAVRLSYEVNEPVDDPVFAVSLRHENGTLISLTTTSAHGIRTGRLTTAGTVELKIPELALLSGDFFVSAYLIDKTHSHVFDEVDRAFPFHVRSPGVAGHEGLLELNATWDMGGLILPKGLS